MKSILKYPGAKNRLAAWICGYMPKHDVYLKPFAGSLAVLFNKQRCHIETVNDLDEEIVNFFKVLRDNNEELMEKIWLTPYSRKEYIGAYKQTEDAVEKARRFAVKCWMGFGCGNLYRNGFKSGQQTQSPNPAEIWAGLPKTIELAAERLKGVQIECLPAVELIKRYDTFGRDLFKAVCDLFEVYHMNRISWTAYEDNPAVKWYRNFIRKHGGKECGHYRQIAKLQDGKLHDSVSFEILAAEFVKIFKKKKI